MDLLLVLVGLAGLWAGTELALRHTLDLAKQHGFSHGFLGLTLLAIGTDFPELVVAVQGGLAQRAGVDASGVVVGNAVGSVITQGSLVLGVAGLFGRLRLGKRLILRDGAVLLLSVLALVLLGLDGTLSAREGGMLCVAYAIYSVMLWQGERSREHPEPDPSFRTGRTLLAIAGGLLLVLLSADLVVEHAVALAAARGWDSTIVGILLIGAGTSLPELTLSLGAAAKGHGGLSVGNIIGSNIFDLLLPMGASALLHPLVIGRGTLLIDLPFVALVSVVAFVAFRKGLQRREAVLLVALYAGFVIVRTTWT